MQRPGRCALLACGIALTLVGAPAAHAAWTPPAKVSEDGVGTRAPQVGVDADGNTTLVWETAGAQRTIRSAFRPAGGPWEGSFTRISAISDCGAPELAVNAAGAAVVAADCATGAAGMRAAYRTAGGSWSSSVAIPGSGAGADPRVGLDAAGNAIVVWETAGGVQSAYRPAAGPWAGPTPVSPPGDVALDPAVAMSGTGGALVVWRHDLSPTDQRATIESSIRRLTGVWTAPQALTPAVTSTVPVSEGEPQVRLNADGDRVAVWANRPPGLRANLLKRWGSGGDFGAWGGLPLWQAVGGGTTDVEVPQVGLAADGGAVAVWRNYDSGGGSFRTQGATTSRTNGEWTPPAVLADAETGLAEPQVAVAPSGRATAVWTSLSPRITAATRPAGGGFQPATTISTPGSSGAADPHVVMTGAGDAVATWAEADTGVARIGVAVDDVTPPVFTSVSVPATVTSGAPAALAASATDAWSPVTLAWTLGDAGTSAGSAVAHAFTTPGERTVTVTAIDAAGNTAAQTRTITVTAPPADGPPAPAPGAATPTPVTLGVSIPRQSWRAIRRAKAVRLRCSLDVPGTCAVTASLIRRTAKRLGLARRVGRRSKAIARGGSPATVRVSLPRKVRRAVGRSRRRVALTLAVTGSAPGRTPVTLTRTLILRKRAGG